MKIMLYGLIFIIVGNIMMNNVSDFESVVISFLGLITALILVGNEKEKKND